KHAFSATSDPATTNNQAFNYIIVGGGLSGLIVAGRLAEDASKTVLVIEAGNDDRNGPRIYDQYQYGTVIDTPLDWAWPTDQNRLRR
ncbi:uncharacterized protein FOMMEDRAFT_33268, partial [Fomitiporia mediterranea MF3/22]|uniref:uncharacterized protein n=1 Tax=Fomitiporia mediterranea (strain MF3/22) TaxID=694068 RepID=UPI0004409A76